MVKYTMRCDFFGFLKTKIQLTTIH